MNQPTTSQQKQNIHILAIIRIEQTFYEPFGDILEGGEESRYSYEGKEFSSETDDYDFDFRKYDPNLMIFTQPDSVVADIYDPQALNRYAFERNNPYKYVDKDGKMPTDIFSNLKYDWRFNQGKEISHLSSDISNTVNSDQFVWVRIGWSFTLKPAYKFTKSYTELLASASYGKEHPFASQNVLKSTEDLISGAAGMGLQIAGIEGVGGEVIETIGFFSDVSIIWSERGALSNQINNLLGTSSIYNYFNTQNSLSIDLSEQNNGGESRNTERSGGGTSGSSSSNKDVFGIKRKPDPFYCSTHSALGC